jgi:N utilization substance protein B
VQNLYAIEISNDYDLQRAENKLIKSVDGLYNLYIYQLSFIQEIVNFAFQKTEEGRNKQLPTPEDLNPNMRFVENEFLHKLIHCQGLQWEIDRLKISWATYPEIVRKIYNAFTESNNYISYMNSAKNTFNRDKKIAEILYFNYILSSESFQMLFEDMDAGWSDDLAISAFFVQKTFNKIKSAKPFDALPPLFKNINDSGSSDDHKFMIDLQRQTLLHNAEYNALIDSHTRNWDFERIPRTDVILLKMALTELQFFRTIPIKVTLNEYIDLTKMFSTPKSSLFINGILDKLIIELSEAGKIKKIGRGLIGN